nr:MAG TPA: hypothetical protein [Caudoviricetes sp.]
MHSICDMFHFDSFRVVSVLFRCVNITSGF